MDTWLRWLPTLVKSQNVDDLNKVIIYFCKDASVNISRILTKEMQTFFFCLHLTVDSEESDRK